MDNFCCNLEVICFIIFGAKTNLFSHSMFGLFADVIFILDGICLFAVLPLDEDLVSCINNFLSLALGSNIDALSGSIEVLWKL